MKSLASWQVVSLISRLAAMFLGLFQTFFIIRILAPSDWGIIQIGMAIGGVFGIYQHLGLSSGSTREISTAKKDTDIFKIFLTSVAIRYLVTIPIAIFLYFNAENIAVGQYNQEVLILPIRIYSFVLLVQGAKGLINSVVSGTQRFKALFIFQTLISVLSVVIYIPLVYFKGIIGFFWAFLLFEFLSTIILGIVAFTPLKGKLELPTREDFVRLTKQLFSIMFAIYIVKVLVTQWEKSGTLLLGRDVSPETVAIFSFAFLFTKKLMHISDAITDVNLPVFSDKFEKDINGFKKLFSDNLNKVFVFTSFSAMSAIFWSKELVYIFVGNNEVYEQSFGLMIPLIFTFIFYGLTNIIKSSIFVPAKYIKELVLSYVLMFLFTGVFYFVMTRLGGYDYLVSITLGMLLGSFLGFFIMVYTSQKRMGFKYFSLDHILLLVQILAVMLVKDIPNLFIKIPAYFVFSGLFTWAIYVAGFVTASELDNFKKKALKLLPAVRIVR